MEKDDVDIVQQHDHTDDRIRDILNKIDSRGPNTAIAKMFLPWMIAVHGFSYGGCEHSGSAGDILSAILCKEAPKLGLTVADFKFLRQSCSPWVSFVRDRHVNSGACLKN